MIIKSIELADYRNYDSLVLQFDRGTNILYGDNAQGKTNILEAIYVAATTKSHKGSKDREIVNFDKEEAHIRTYLEKDGKEIRVDMHLRKSKSKGIAIDGQKNKKPIIVNITDSGMELKINSALGSMNEEIDIQKQGKDLMIGFNPKFLIDALRVIDDEEVDLYMVNPKAPCFIKNAEESYIYLILPVNFTTVA